jgi:YggT family protein
MSNYLYTFIWMLFRILTLAIFIRALLSWVDQREEFRIGPVYITRLVRDMTEPILAPIRALLNSLMPNMMMFDLSPLIAIMLLEAMNTLILRTIR